MNRVYIFIVLLILIIGFILYRTYYYKPKSFWSKAYSHNSCPTGNRYDCIRKECRESNLDYVDDSPDKLKHVNGLPLTDNATYIGLCE